MALTTGRTAAPTALDRLLYPSLYAKGASKGTGRKITANERVAGEYRTYAEARRSSAERATNGNILNDAGRKAGISPGQWFTGRQVSTKYASEELKDWLKAHGPTLSPSEYRAQSIDTPRAAAERDARSAGS